jgi:ABC-2 type transport system permease protein
MTTSLLTVGNEIGKSFLHDWHYQFDRLVELIVMAMTFTGLSFLVGGGRVEKAALPGALLGYVVWLCAAKVIVTMSWNLRQETQTGTLEQMYMSPTPAEFLLLGQAISRLITTAILVTPLVLVMVFVLDVELPLRAATLPILLLTLLGLFGFGLLLAGATLLFKQVESFADLVQYGLIFFNGALIPIERFPAWLAAVAQTLPTTQGIRLLRQVMLDGQSLSDLWREGSLIWLFIHSLCFFVGGWLLFKWCESAARRRGTLGQY